MITETNNAPRFSSLREKIAYEKQARLERNAAYADQFAKAYDLGMIAGRCHKPRAMAIVEADFITGKPLEGATVHIENEGPCGFAWVNVKGANKGFGHWLIKQGLARKGYYGGAEIWIGAHGQSYERKAKHADVMAEILRGFGINCYASGRLD